MPPLGLSRLCGVIEVPLLRVQPTPYHCHHNQHLGTNQAHPLELTLAIIKPHIVSDPHSLLQIRRLIRQQNFYFLRTSLVSLTRSRAEQFYSEHRDKFFFERLVTCMSSGACAVHALAAPNAIARWRQLMGPTKVFRTQVEQPDTIRARFGVSDTRNAVHGSDSPESAQREVDFFFPTFDWPQWTEVLEPALRLHSLGWNRAGVRWNATKWEHEVKVSPLVLSSTN